MLIVICKLIIVYYLLSSCFPGIGAFRIIDSQYELVTIAALCWDMVETFFNLLHPHDDETA